MLFLTTNQQCESTEVVVIAVLHKVVTYRPESTEKRHAVAVSTLCSNKKTKNHTYIHIYTHLTALCPGLPGWAGTRKVKPICISLKQETVSGSGISWAVCKSALRSRQITMPAPHHSVFYRPDALPGAQPTASKHWRTKKSKWPKIKGIVFLLLEYCVFGLAASTTDNNIYGSECDI